MSARACCASRPSSAVDEPVLTVDDECRLPDPPDARPGAVGRPAAGEHGCCRAGRRATALATVAPPPARPTPCAASGAGATRGQSARRGRSAPDAAASAHRARRAARRRRRAAVAAARPPRQRARARRRAAARTPARTESKPRLQLEAGQVSPGRSPSLAAQEQASAARATASAAEAAASAAAERMRQMEAEMARVRAEAKAQTDALLQLRQQLALDRAQREQAVAADDVADWRARRCWLRWPPGSPGACASSRAAAQRGDWWDRGVALRGRIAAATSPGSRTSRLRAPHRCSAMPSAPAPWSDNVPSTHGGRIRRSRRRRCRHRRR